MCCFAIACHCLSHQNACDLFYANDEKFVSFSQALLVKQWIKTTTRYMAKTNNDDFVWIGAHFNSLLLLLLFSFDINHVFIGIRLQPAKSGIKFSIKRTFSEEKKKLKWNWEHPINIERGHLFMFCLQLYHRSFSFD